ncbi:zinc finger protein 436-like isoform X1 [Oreochromis aureus]|uniref:zinc finger protein 436-like isoform X1 n=2 Tax=Oreochromis aureus TaxID=47969 RepID=UPI001953AFBE|nr:zinc finger protein 436-like isoform X1 [Oreochromis aureus]
MPSVQYLREFINERLTAAAEQIFLEFEKTIVQYEEEIDRQRRLLDITWKPQIKLHRTDVPQQQVCEEEEEGEVLPEQQLWNQERSSSVEQEEPEPPQIKEEQEELCSSQEGEQLGLKEEPEVHNDPVQYEEEMERQRRLLDITWKPQIKLHRTDLRQQHVCKEEEVLPEQQLWNQERSSSVDQEEPEPPQIKEEQEELCSSQEGEQLGLKEETDTFMVTAAEEGEHSEPGGDGEQLLSPSSAGGESQDQRGNKYGASELPHHQNMKEVLQEQQFSNPERNPSLGQEEPQGQLLLEDGTDTFMLTATCEESDHSDSETDSEQLLCDDSPETESRDQETSKQEESGLTEDAGSKPKKGHQGKETYQLSLPISVSQCNDTFSMSQGKKHHMIQNNVKLYVCKICRKIFVRRYHLSMHMRIHTGEKPYSCETCGKRFSIKRSLARHITAHTGEKPYCCETCGKSFSAKNSLSYHITTHSGEKPYSCEICRKRFGQSSALYLHKKTHTGEKPYHCDICGKSFRQAGHLSRHKKTHTGEKPYSCETCGKSFSQSSVLYAHKKIHTGEKPYHCEICGKNFSQKSHLSRHKKTHTAEKL